MSCNYRLGLRLIFVLFLIVKSTMSVKVGGLSEEAKQPTEEVRDIVQQVGYALKTPIRSHLIRK